MLGPSDLLPMQSLVRAPGPSGWTTCSVRGPNQRWIGVRSMGGASTTAPTVKMREWCAKVGVREGGEGGEVVMKENFISLKQKYNDVL